MIARAEVMPLLRSACPSFERAWQRHVTDPSYQDGLLYVDLGEYARHLVRLYQENATGEFEAVFEAVERLHVEGDAFVREAATIGLLEGIQNNAGHEGLDPEVFLPFLGHESGNWWRKLNAFWSGDPHALREMGESGQVRGETAPPRYRVMADTGSSGIWLIEPRPVVGTSIVFRHSMISFNQLRLPADLVARFEAWIDRYEHGVHDFDEFNRTGVELARALKSFLPPDVYVEYEHENPRGTERPPATVVK